MMIRDCMLIIVMMFLSLEIGVHCVRRTPLKHLIPAPCPPGYFPCNSTEHCVEQKWNCDKKEDCPDGSDEWQCTDKIRSDFWDSFYKKRPDEDREKKRSQCGISNPPQSCRCSEKSLFCNHQGLTKLPVLHPDVEEIDLSGNRFHILQQRDFPVLKELKTLILTSSEVILIHENAFKNLIRLERLYLTSNSLAGLGNGIFESNGHLKLLVLSHNPLAVLSPGAFRGLHNVEEIDLKDCKLKTIPDGIFNDLFELRILSLTRNNIESVNELAFGGLRNLRSLVMSKNKLHQLESSTFGNMSSLIKLDLQNNELRSVSKDTFSSMVNLESLNLKNNGLRDIQPGTFDNLTSLSYIYFHDFHLCSLAQHVRVCEPRGDGISSIAHLLDSVVLRVSVWLVACIASIGNIAVLIGRLLFFSEPNAVHSFYIKNLSLSDLLMSVYLFVIAAHDVAFRGEYIVHEASWRHSWQCNFCGFLSTLSSESSVLILTIITIDRYTSILHPLSLKRRTITSASIAMITVWTLAIILSALPTLKISYYGDEFYGNNGVCLPLQIHDPYGQAWEYSTFLFCGVNSAAFLFILFAYISMFFTISNSRIGLRCTQQVQDRTIAKRFAFIVGTDFLCWIPIVLIKVIAMTGVEIQEDLYAWVAVFLLPVNSALNPVLYTLTTKLFKQQLAKIVYSCRVPNTSSNDNSGISLTSILHTKSGKKTLVTRFSLNDSNAASKTSIISGSPAQNRSSFSKAWKANEASENLI